MEIHTMEVIKEFLMRPENQNAIKYACDKMEGRIMTQLAE